MVSAAMTPAHNSGSDSPFDAIKRTDEHGEHWSARDLQVVMAYARWENFEVPLRRAMKAAENVGTDVTSNFLRSQKINGSRSVTDYELTRYAAYLVAMNGDPNKPEVAAAQTYFAVKTREAEIAQPVAPRSELDILRAAIDQIEQAQQRAARAEQAAIEAASDARAANARIDAMEGRHNWFSALGYAIEHGMPTDSISLARFGKVAASIARADGITPNKVQHAHYGSVNEFPIHVWDRARDALGGAA